MEILLSRYRVIKIQLSSFVYKPTYLPTKLLVAIQFPQGIESPVAGMNELCRYNDLIGVAGKCPAETKEVRVPILAA